MGTRSKKIKAAETVETKKVSASVLPSSNLPARLEFIAAGLITLWLVILHFIYLRHAGPLWRDEVGTIDFATMPTLGDIWRNLQYDNFPPLFLFVARAWAFIGSNSDFSFRVLGFVVGLATIGVFWFSARTFGARVPLLCLSLYALNPLTIRVGDSMRSYGLGYVLLLLTLTFFWKFINEPKRKWFWITALATVLSVQCLYQSAFFIVAFAIGAWTVTLAKNERKVALSVLFIGVLSALSLLPHLPNVMKGQDWFGISKVPVDFSRIWKSLVEAMSNGGALMPWIWIALFVAVLGLTFFGKRKSRAWNQIYCAAVLLSGVLLFFGFLRGLGVQTPRWYFLILLAPTALVIDVISGSASSNLIRYSRIVAALGIAVFTVPLSFSGVQLRQTNVDLIAKTLQEKVQPGDMVLVSPWYYGVSLQRYCDAKAFITLPPMDEIRIHRYDIMKRYMMSEKPIAPLLDQIQKTLREGHTLWIVGLVIIQPNLVPPVYPPYQPGSAVNDAAYFSSWLQEIGSLLQSRATKADQFPIPSSEQINPLENLSLYAISGWRGEK